MNKKMMVGLLVTLLILVSGFVLWRSTAEKATYVTLESGTVEKTVSFKGLVDAFSKRHPVTMEDAMILSIEAKKGSIVKKDDPILEIELSKRSVMNKAMASQIELLQALFTQTGNESLAENGKPYLDIYDKALKQYNDANSQYDNVVGLMAAGAVTSADIKEASLTLTEKTDRLNTAEEKIWTFVTQLDPVVYKDQTKTFEAVKKMYEDAKLEQKRMIIKAAVDGVVTDVYVEEGLMVRKNGLLFELSDPSKLIIQAEVDESIAPSLKVGMNAEVTVKDKVDAQAVTITSIGKNPIEKVNESGVVKKVVSVSFGFKEGQFGIALLDQPSIKMVLGHLENVVVIPKSLVAKKDKGFIVYVNENGRVAEKQLVIALEGDDAIAVKKGFKAGDQLIKPSKELKPGDRLRK